MEAPKFREMILLIARRSEGDPAFGATKLNKLLFFVDFAAMRRFGKPISNAHYQKLSFGPAPRELLPIKTQLVADGLAIELTRHYFGKRQVRLTPIHEPIFEALSANEVALIDEVIDQYRDDDATSVSALSHEFDGWRYAREGEDIPYETAVLRMRPSSESDIERGRALNRQYSWTVQSEK